MRQKWGKNGNFERRYCLVDDSWTIDKGMTVSVLQNPLRTRLHTTGERPFVVPPHWHTMHDEHHIVLKGTLFVTQDGVRKVVRPEDGPLLTRRGVVHSLEILAGEEAIIEETTLQSDEVTEQKTIFFRSLFFPGVMQSFLSVMQVFYHGDGYPELPTGIRWLEWLMVVFLGGWVAPVARV
ncbi:Cupin-2 domain-containing protein [Mycena venus]|uniref:Cupin-2 domain-containing protein n=1 Tax=Mycena venus TaxID=2733690 RepID=A0A8H7CGT0_9AGAR|nr:Cupin-2 domain-containing protein [Mycena venus]